MTPNNKGQTLAVSKLFERAPASNISQGASKLFGVRIIIPIFEDSNLLDISELHLWPLLISSGVK